MKTKNFTFKAMATVFGIMVLCLNANAQTTIQGQFSNLCPGKEYTYTFALSSGCEILWNVSGGGTNSNLTTPQLK